MEDNKAGWNFNGQNADQHVNVHELHKTQRVTNSVVSILRGNIIISVIWKLIIVFQRLVFKDYRSSLFANIQLGIYPFYFKKSGLAKMVVFFVNGGEFSVIHLDTISSTWSVF